MPAGVVTESGPFFAPLGTVVVICVPLLPVMVATAPPPNVTVAPVKFVPLIVTRVPTLPDVGVKDVIVGADGLLVVTVNTPELEPEPFGPETLIAPVDAPVGTVAVICESLLTVNVVAFVVPNVTVVTPVKCEPLIDTDVPTGPLVGVKPEMVGAVDTDPEQPGNWKDPMRVSQLSWLSVVGWAS